MSKDKFDTNFFLNLDLESSDVEDAALDIGFTSEVYGMLNDNSNYVENLRSQMEAFKRLENRNKKM